MLFIDILLVLFIEIIIYIFSKLFNIYVLNNVFIKKNKNFMDYSGPETLDNEYKEFYLDLDSTILHELDRRDISELIYYKLDHPSYYLNDFFNQSIYNKLNENFLKYFPIYCASFTKSIFISLL